jgi:anaerobic dimethyl sulfoxide reductase subunit A
MSENNFLSNALTDTLISRRSFLKWSAVLGGATALGGGLEVGLKPAELASAAGTVQVATTACYHNCGGRCIVRAQVTDGVVTRILSDTDPVDSIDRPRAVACLRGRAQKRRVYSAERLKYPLKRVGKRGEGNFARITWDEALDTIASQMKRIKDKYGNESFYFMYASGTQWSGPDGRNASRRMMRLFGGYTDYYGSYSTACLTAVQPYITNSTGNSSDDLLNSKLIVLFSDNPVVTRSGGDGEGYFFLKAKEAGTKFIIIDPRQTDSVVALNADWIPIYPGTDVALIAALAYVMVKENLYDKEFMAKYSVGFDEDTLPAGTPPKSSWMAYIMGDADGQAKTPEWASAITGIPADRIVKLAREMATTKPCAMIQGYGWQRRAYGEQPVRALPILAAMTGNYGISGGGPGMPSSKAMGVTMGSIPLPPNPIKPIISVYMWPDFISRGTEMTSGPRDRIKGADKINSNMKFMWNHGGNTLINQHSDVNGTSKLLADETKLEFIVSLDVVMTPSNKFADILLPVATSFETENIITGGGNGKVAWALYSHKVIEPLFEDKDEYWISEQIANRLGIGDAFRENHATREDWMKEMVAAARAKHTDFPTYDEFKNVGVYKTAAPSSLIAFAGFRKDPVANPMTTETKKIEIFSPFLFKQNDPKEIPAIPKYIPEWEGVSDPLRSKFPLLMVTAHAVQRSHSTFDNVDYLREAHVQALEINEADAEARGVKNGDMVKVFNDRGTIIVPARVTPRIRPGVVNLPQGAWYTPDASGADVRGCANTLTKYQPTPFAKGNPQHTNLVQVQKA